ncbi:MAG TPA: YfiR family protein [Gammaproteobacteria bacterium]|nr:YfiR family protein [Gammaproteobacteria bacterium]
MTQAIRRFFELTRAVAPALLALAFAWAATRATLAQAPRAAPLADASYSQAQVKAAFLYRFGSYVRWPTLATPDDSITIDVLDDPEIAAELESFAAGRKIEGRSVRVRRIRTIEALADDQILFIGSDENPRLDRIIEAVGKKPILIVTDAQGGLAAGAMINFQVLDQRVRFEISLSHARAAGLDLSSRLLAAAIKVETSGCYDQCRDTAGPPRQLAEDSGRHAV